MKRTFTQDTLRLAQKLDLVFRSLIRWHAGTTEATDLDDTLVLKPSLSSRKSSTVRLTVSR